MHCCVGYMSNFYLCHVVKNYWTTLWHVEHKIQYFAVHVFVVKLNEYECYTTIQ